MPWDPQWLGGYWFGADWFGPESDPGSVSASLSGSASVSATLTSTYTPPVAAAATGGGGGRPGRLRRTVEDARVNWDAEAEVLLLCLVAAIEDDP